MPRGISKRELAALDQAAILSIRRRKQKGRRAAEPTAPQSAPQASEASAENPPPTSNPLVSPPASDSQNQNLISPSNQPLLPGVSTSQAVPLLAPQSSEAPQLDTTKGQEEVEKTSEKAEQGLSPLRNSSQSTLNLVKQEQEAQPEVRGTQVSKDQTVLGGYPSELNEPPNQSVPPSPSWQDFPTSTETENQTLAFRPNAFTTPAYRSVPPIIPSSPNSDSLTTDILVRPSTVNLSFFRDLQVERNLRDQFYTESLESLESSEDEEPEIKMEGRAQEKAPELPAAGPPNGSSSDERTYSKTQFRVDAIIIKSMYASVKKGKYMFLESQLTPEIVGMANGIILALQPSYRAELRMKAQARIEQTGITQYAGAFEQLVANFMQGPTEFGEDDETPEPAPRPQPQHNTRGAPAGQPQNQRNVHQSSERQRPQKTATHQAMTEEIRPSASRQVPSPSYDEEIIRETTRDRTHHGTPYVENAYGREVGRRYQAPPRQMGFIPSGRSAFHYSPPRHAPCADPYRPSNARSDRTIAASFQRRLKASDIQEFDGDTSVNLFVRRIVSMVNRYGEQEVLAVLPLCLKGNARIWYDTLSPTTLDEMDDSVDLWIQHLRARFQKNPLRADEEARRCKFSFAQEHKMDLRTYITQKQNLLVEAGVEDPHIIMQRLWQDLDPTLQMSVAPNPYFTLEDFIQQLYFQEYAAQRMWQQMSSMQNPYRGPYREERQENRQWQRNDIYGSPRRVYIDEPSPSSNRMPAPALPSPTRNQRLITGKENNDRSWNQNPSGLPDKIKGRARYPCTHCNSMDHLDNACPQKPSGNNHGIMRTKARVHFADDEGKENYQQVPLDEDQIPENDYHGDDIQLNI